MMDKYGHLLLACFFLLFSSSCKKDTLLTEDTYTEVTIKQENLPDFSFAGYRQSKTALPTVPEKVVVSPGEGDDTALIQAAIDSVSGLPETDGFRGAILLKAGTYEIGHTLRIRASGVVLRGEGQGEDGTILVATSRGEHITSNRAAAKQRLALIRLEGSGNGYEQSGHTAITAPAVVGATSVQISSAGGFKAGDTIVVVKTTNDEWINTLDMAQYGWTAAEYQIPQLRVVEKVTANTLHLDIPLVDRIDDWAGGGYVAHAALPGRISRSGIENMRLVSVYEHDQDEAHTWAAIRVARAVNSWVRNVSALHFAFSCVGLYSQSDFITIQDCAMLAPKSQPIGDRRYSFYISNGTGNLFQRCYSEEGRHDFVTSARVSGPNVFLDCYAENALDETGPHHRWATGTLYDNVFAGRIAARNRKDLGSGHGWTAAQNMFWNCKAPGGFYVENPPGAINWTVGCQGEFAGDAYRASAGIPVIPRSLFLEQLKNRLGAAAIDKVTISEQREVNAIWERIRYWGGDGTPLVGIANNQL